jgi:hypothetical protein
MVGAGFVRAGAKQRPELTQGGRAEVCRHGRCGGTKLSWQGSAGRETGRDGWGWEGVAGGRVRTGARCREGPGQQSA